MNQSKTTSTSISANNRPSTPPGNGQGPAPKEPDPAPDVIPTPAYHQVPINILIVDDEPKNLTVLETILSDPNYRLVRAESADQALLALVVEEFALLILDIRMPGMTGFELAQMIKDRKKTAGVPIIFLTAYYNEDQHVLEGYGTGAVDYLHKPVNPAILRSKVAVFAELHRKNLENEFANRALLAEVTERRRAEEELRELNETLEQRVTERTEALALTNAALKDTGERYRSLFDGSLDAVISLRSNGYFAEANPAAQQLTGRTLEELKNIHFLDLCIPEERKTAEQAFQSALNHQCLSLDTTMIAANGERRQLFISGAPAVVGGEVVGVSCIARDMTDRLRMLNELRENDRRKDEFLAMLAHELRNPLAPISNAVQIIRLTGSRESALDEASSMIERQVKHMVSLVDDLLDVSRVSRGKIQLNMTPCDLGAIVQQVVEVNRSAIDARHQTLGVTLPAQPIFVEGDFTRLVQVIGNMLNNATKYTDDGGQIWLTIEPTNADSEAPGEVAIRIRDSGRGIDPSSLKSVFDLFYQANRTIDRSEGGLGIGLSLVKNLVDMLGGRVEAKSAGLGQGSEFSAYLPCLREVASVSCTVDPAVSEPAGRLRVLLVDDNFDSVESMAMLLKHDGHEVLKAHHGEEGVALALEHLPDVVLLDIGLPGLDGLAACKKMRALGLQDALILAMTGYGQQEDRLKSQEAGFDFHLVKPVDLFVVREQLAKLTAKRWNDQDASQASTTSPQAGQ